MENFKNAIQSLATLTLFCILFLVMALSAFARAGNTDNAIIDYGTSDKFSQTEIESAVDAVLLKFEKHFKNCRLIKLWYDEEKAIQLTENYFLYSRGMINGINRDNVIFLHSEFHVGSKACVSLGRNSTITNWHWTLIREKQTDEWELDDWGY